MMKYVERYLTTPLLAQSTVLCSNVCLDLYMEQQTRGGFQLVPRTNKMQARVRVDGRTCLLPPKRTAQFRQNSIPAQRILT